MASPTEPGHCPDEVLLALLHDEPVALAGPGHAHVINCVTCMTRSERLAEEHAVVGMLLASLDHPMPAIAARPPTRVAVRSRRRRIASLVGAAATLAAAALAALPNSPVRRWLRDEGKGVAAVVEATADAPTTASPAASSGIAISATKELIVRFVHQPVSGTLELRAVDRTDVTITSRGGATGYDVADGEVTIDNREPAEAYLIGIPPGVIRLQVRAGARTLLTWPADITTHAIPGLSDAMRLTFPTALEQP